MASECTNLNVGIMLHGYELRALTETEMERFEAHLLECDTCFQELQAFEQLSGLLLHDNLIIQQASQVASAEARGESRWGRLWHHLWPEVPFVLKPAVIYVVALLAVISTYGVLRTTIIAPVRVVTEKQFFSMMRSSEEKVFHKGSQVAVLLFDLGSAKLGESFHLIWKFEESTVVLEDTAFQAFGGDGIGTLFLPTANMKVGYYHLRISSPRPDSSKPDQEFYFRIEE